MAGRPPKPVSLLKLENKSHRTKAELETREKAEKALLTGISLKEWPDTKKNPIAHKEFNRIKKLLKAIEKDDALHESVINRYCLLIAECKEFEEMMNRTQEDIKELKDLKEHGEIDALTYLDKKGQLQGYIMDCDKKIMDKRKMLLQIEKENIMTIAAALRSIPKTPEKQKQSKMGAFLTQRGVGNAT